MWVALGQILKQGRNHLKGFKNVSCHRKKIMTCNTLNQERWLCTQVANRHKELLNPVIRDKPTMHQRIKLNSDFEGEPYILTQDEQDCVSEKNAENMDKLNELLLQLRLYRETGKELPDTIRLEDLNHMQHLSYIKLCTYLHFLMRNQYMKQSQTLKKAKKRSLIEQQKKDRLERESLLEHPWLERSNLMLPIQKRHMHNFYNTNALLGLQFGQKVIIDCSYNSYMNDFCLKLTAKQILFCFYSSRKNRRPFSLHICNLDHDSRLMYYLQKMHGGFDSEAAIGIHSKSYLDLFEREKLVYLTPHTSDLLDYNPEDMYIIGGFVDKNQLKLSQLKADKEGLRCAALPLDNYLQWKNGTKNLCLHHCLDILLDVKNTGDWLKALQTHVPSRKKKTHSSPSPDMQERITK